MAETPESERVEVEPGVEFVVETKEKSRQAAKHDFFTHLICFNLVIPLGYLCLCITYMYCIVLPIFHAFFPSFKLLFLILIMCS